MNNKIIIVKNISSLEFIELRDCMQNCIRESIIALGSDDKEGIMWYEDCGMEDYFKEWMEIWAEDEYVKIGDGLETIDHKFVLNDDTRADFESAFEQARDAAFEERISEIVEEVEEYEPEGEIEVIKIDNSLTDEEKSLLKKQEEGLKESDEAEILYEPSDFIADRIDEICDKLKGRGYKELAYDSYMNYEFYVENGLCKRLVDEGCSVEQVAAWLGASIVVNYQGSDAFDYQMTWFKKTKIFCDFDFHELLVQAEGGWDGWYYPVWAKVVEDEVFGDSIELTLGDQVSGNTSFYEGDLHHQPKSWVGCISVWHRTWQEDDAEAYAEECMCKPEDFDSDENMRNEALGYINDGRFDEQIEGLKKSIIEFAKSEGYEGVDF